MQVKASVDYGPNVCEPVRHLREANISNPLLSTGPASFPLQKTHFASASGSFSPLCGKKRDSSCREQCAPA
jgi:hypothetical protein